MTEKMLINIDDLKRCRPISEGLKIDRIEPYIREAQRLDLRPLLGDALYFDFVQNFDVIAYPQYVNYQALINGEQYVYGGATIVFDGIINMLCYFTLARLALNNPINFTSYGITTKVNSESSLVDAKTLTLTISELKSIAISYSSQLIQYLYINQAKFPLYPQLASENLNKIGVKFFDPDESNSSNNKIYPLNLR